MWISHLITSVNVYGDVCVDLTFNYFSERVGREKCVCGIDI